MLITAFALFAVGLCAGILAGLFGIGGGLVIVPALTWLLLGQGLALDHAVPMAVATSLGTMLMTAASAVWFHHRRLAIDWHCVTRLAPAVALGGAMGATIAVFLPGEALARVFAVLAAIIGARMLLDTSVHVSDRHPFPRGWWLMGPAIGAVSAMIGIGGGTFNVPYLARNGYTMVRAVAIASTCGWPIALGGVLVFALLADNIPDWPYSLGYVWMPGLLLIGLGGVVAAPGGVALAHRLPARRLRRLFGLVLILVAIRMAW